MSGFVKLEGVDVRFLWFSSSGGFVKLGHKFRGLMDFTHITNYTIMILRVVEVEDTMIGCLIILLKEKLAGNLFWTYP